VHASPQTAPLIVVPVASKVTGCSRSGLPGEAMNAAFAAPGPSSRIDIERDVILSKFWPTGVATIETTSTGALLGGAMNSNVARPSLPVTTSAGESVPP
jgi:hypothetical protein